MKVHAMTLPIRVYVLREGRIVSEHHSPASLADEVSIATGTLQLVTHAELAETSEGRAVLRRWEQRAIEN